MKRLMYILGISFLVACGGGSNGGKQEVTLEKVVGIWKSDGSSIYEEYTASGEIKLYLCTINNGYVKSEVPFATIDDTAFEGVYLSGNGNQILDKETNKVLGEKVSEVPTECFGDAVEITSFTPTHVNGGATYQFAVSYQYRLSSTDSVDLTFVLDTGKEESILLDLISIDQKGTATGSFMANVEIPEIDDGANVSLEVYMDSDNESYILHAADLKLLQTTSK